jgi:predicted negative regulator of RcsB-dependent stress response
VDRAHRHDLKHDKFVEQVGHTVEYAAGHRSQFILYGAIALGVIVLAAGAYWYMQRQSGLRQDALRTAIRTQEAATGQQGTPFLIAFPDAPTKTAAVKKAWEEIATKYPGSSEALVAEYYMGINAADAGNLPEAEKRLKVVADSGKSEYSSQAKLSLARIYESSGRKSEAEKLLRGLVNDPTIMVSKEEATLALGQLLTSSNPAEARKMLEPLRASRSAVSRAAIAILSEIPAAR